LAGLSWKKNNAFQTLNKQNARVLALKGKIVRKRAKGTALSLNFKLASILKRLGI
jgi:hypothetical protein